MALQHYLGYFFIRGELALLNHLFQADHIYAKWLNWHDCREKDYIQEINFTTANRHCFGPIV